MRTLSIDLETFSEVDIKSAGAYKYAENCEILLFAYSFDGQAPQIIDMTKDFISAELLDALTDENILKLAFNASFERAVLQNCLLITLPPEQWEDTMVRAAMAGLPLSLESSAAALGLAQQKDTAGKMLIRHFSIPCKPTKTNGMRTRNLPEHSPDKWEDFKRYCIQDVVTEQAISKALQWIKIPEFERKLWCLDQRINERGLGVDLILAKNAISLDARFNERLFKEAIELTGLSNANSVAQIKAWLEKEEDITITTLAKDSLAELLKTVTSDRAKRLIRIRQDLSKTSVKKFVAMLNAVGEGQRIRGLFQYYGATKTGRWAGRLVQVQNLPRGSFKPHIMEEARKLVLQNDIEWLETCLGPIPDTLSNLIRTAFVPKKGNRLVVSDFSAIEARVIAWFAEEKWRLDVFRTHGKIYEASASTMFKIPIEQIGKDSPYRQKGKVTELSCGYQGGPAALIRMGALEQGVVPKEIMDLPDNYREFLDTKGKRYVITKEKKIKGYLQELITAWRKASPNIVQLWYDTQEAATEAIKTRQKVHVAKGVYFQMHGKHLLMWLPSGRFITYPYTTIKLKTVVEEYEIIVNGMVMVEERKRTSEAICYWATNQTTRKWEEQDTYGGKLVENLVQAFARDCLGYAMLNIEAGGYTLVGHVHDEAIADVPKGYGSLEEFNKLMVKKAPWMGDLPLKAEGFETQFYKKD